MHAANLLYELYHPTLFLCHSPPHTSTIQLQNELLKFNFDKVHQEGINHPFSHEVGWSALDCLGLRSLACFPS